MRRLLVAVAFLALAAEGRAGCDFKEALKEARLKLEKIEPKVSGYGEYSQTLVLKNGSEWKTRLQPDYSSREIPLAILDPCDCSISVHIVKRTINGFKLSKPNSSIKIELAPRPFGPIWNDFNTQFFVPGK